MLGGDVTGKLLVPIVAGARRRLARQRGRCTDPPAHAEERRALRKRSRDDGPLRRRVADDDEQARLRDDPASATTASSRRCATLLHTLDACSPRSGSSPPASRSTRCSATTTSRSWPTSCAVGRLRSITPRDSVVPRRRPRDALLVGFSTPTPWHTPRELTEDELAASIAALADQLDDPVRAVFNLHCPPADTHLDQAAKLDEDLRPVVDAAARDAPPGRLAGGAGGDRAPRARCSACTGTSTSRPASRRIERHGLRQPRLRLRRRRAARRDRRPRPGQGRPHLAAGAGLMAEILWVNPVGTPYFDDEAREMIDAVRAPHHTPRIRHIEDGPPHLEYHLHEHDAFGPMLAHFRGGPGRRLRGGRDRLLLRRRPARAARGARRCPSSAWRRRACSSRRRSATASR